MGFKYRGANFKSWLKPRFMMTDITAPTIWPMTVAAAAPATPIRGKGPRPKMSTGSMTMLMTAPTPWVHMVRAVLPVDWSRRSNMTLRKRPAEQAQQIVR